MTFSEAIRLDLGNSSGFGNRGFISIAVKASFTSKSFALGPPYQGIVRLIGLRILQQPADRESIHLGKSEQA
jgi:hypothetical protein